MNDQLILVIAKALMWGGGSTLAGMLGWLIKRILEEKFAEWKARRELLEAHIKDCNKKNTQIELLHQKVEAISDQAEENSRERRWQSECIAAICAKIDVRAPERP